MTGYSIFITYKIKTSNYRRLFNFATFFFRFGVQNTPEHF